MDPTVVSGIVDIVSRYDQDMYLQRQSYPRIVTLISTSSWDYYSW